MLSPSPHIYRVALLALILCAFALRVYKLDSQSLWYDEGVTAIVAQYDLASLAQWTADDIQPPLYYALLAGWGRLVGWGEWSLRFPSVVCGLLIVPLLSALALRWNGSRLAAILAGLLTALHPLLLYYSQEARMYSLLVALGVAAGYWVLGIGYWAGATPAATEQKRGEAKRFQAIQWSVYVALAAAALYTHYFAVFLLLAVNGAYLLQLFRNPHRTLQTPPNIPYLLSNTFPWLLANAAVLLLYLPWLGNLFTRLDVDASYWEGSLKLWEALRAVAIRFTSGETVLEGQAARLLWMYAGVTLLALFGLGTVDGLRLSTDTPSSRFLFRALRFIQNAIHNARYPLIILCIPIIAVLTLASFTPKFNARYVMVALPGLLLLWSAGLAGLLRAFVPLWQRLQRVACNTEPRALPALAGLVGTGLLLAGFVQADRNWFTDTAFTKDQWRELTRYVQGQIGENDAVVLVSGHAWPIWRYYAPEIAPVRLPAIEILDVHAVVDLENSAAILRPALLGKSGVWLVDWQEEVIDPADAAGLQLERSGDEQPLEAQFWGLRLRRFVNLDARAISNAPPIQQPIQANFGDTVELLGYSVEKQGDLLLFWRLTHPSQPLPDLHLTGETRTAEGLLYSRIGDRRLSAYDFPTFRWQLGQIVAGRIPVDEWIGAGAPPGNYQLRLGVYDPAGDPAGLDLLSGDGERLGKRTAVEIELPQPIPLPPEEEPSRWHPLQEGLFVRSIPVTSSASPGEQMLLQMLWYSETPRAVGELVVHWSEQKRAVQWASPALLVDLALVPGQALRTVHQIPVPVDLPPGEYWLGLSIDSPTSHPLDLPVTILPANRSFDLPPLNPALAARFGGQVTLAGLTENQIPAELVAGSPLPLHFVWQSITPTADYTMSVQWLDGDGRPAGQRDEWLPRGSSAWLPNEVVSQIIELAAPEQPGEYQLIVAVYDANRSGLPRLYLANGDDFVQVARVHILPTAQP